jgi:hypothetical protein
VRLLAGEVLADEFFDLRQLLLQVELSEFLLALQSESRPDAADEGSCVLEEGVELCYAGGAVEFEAGVGFPGFGLVGRDSELLCVYLVEFLLALNLLGECGVVVVEFVDFLVELVDVLVDEVVLLLVLQEGRRDLLEVGSPALLFDLFKALPNRSHRPAVVLHYSHALLVLHDQLP